MMSAFGGVWLFGRMIAWITMRVDREATAELRNGVSADDGDFDGGLDIDPDGPAVVTDGAETDQRDRLVAR
jgi:hypothetical protein